MPWPMGSSKAAYLALALTACAGCAEQDVKRPEIHGHRGCRGLSPENTVPAFLKAAALGADWIELDVVISGDGQVVVSHEPWMSRAICTGPDGEPIPAGQERAHNIYRMTAAELQLWDCGGLELPEFPDQERRRAHKPTLREVAEALEEASMAGIPEPGFNIEIKSDPGLYGTCQPQPAEFARIVHATLDSLGLTGRCIVQSFDPEALRAMRAIDPELPLALLVENADGPQANLARLGFKPEIYSPQHALVDEALVGLMHGQGIRVLAWTVNEPEDIRRMAALGVDGIITDYPDRALALLD